jgi:hypothetical protein
MRKRDLFARWCVILLIAPFAIARGQDSKSAVDLISPPEEGVKSITAHDVESNLRFLASDFLRGRDTASAEIKIAQEYIAAQLAADGAEPMGDRVGGRRTYFARFPLERSTPEPEATKLTLIYDKDGAKREEPLTYGAGFTALPVFSRTTQFEAPVVFAGYGIVDESKQLDDYKDLDVRNRIVVIRDGVPEGSEGFRGNVFGKLSLAMSKGAYALIVVKQPGAAGASAFSQMRIRMGRGGLSLPTSDSAIPVLQLEDSARDALTQLVGAGIDEWKKGPIEGLKMHVATQTKKEQLEDRNVIALFPGTDPEKRKEVVIYSAHLDHEGVNDRGEIMNGSDDNASGSTALIEIAEAYALGAKPARSVAFLWVAGEEKGLLGSQWFSDHSTLPEDYKIVADINMDMVSRNAGKEVSICPSPKHPEFNTLITAGEAACKAEEMTAKFNADEFYARTDSYNFARKGIPIIFFFSGLHADYHRPTDDVDKADFEKAARIARVAYRLGWHVANAGDLPKKLEKPAE